ncbi:MAG: penicillin-binding protein 2 [Thermoleophilia bacterium]|nr:penicillin-binding protein 2 [Thermoleophilia bacterium]
MNPPIRKLFYVTVLLFASLIAMLGYRQIIQAQDLAENPQNTRKVYAQMRIERGLILANDRIELARNHKENDLYYRLYPTGDMMPHLVGYSNPTYGQVGLEHSQNSWLTGTADEVELVNLVDTLTGKQKRGADLKLTIDPGVQRIALGELQKIGKRGAVVVIEVKTGAVVAMASNPTYDPNELDSNWLALNADPNAPLFNRATQGLYTPGSTFKILTTAAALESGTFTPQSRFRDDRGTVDIYGFTVHNYRTEPFGEHNLSEAFSESINTTFAQVGDQLGQNRMTDTMEDFGFYEKPPFDLPADEVAASGRYENGELLKPDDPMDRTQVASMAFGQEQLLVTPLQMALVAESIANGGKMMKPYSVDSVSDYNGTIVHQASPEVWKTPLQPDTASDIKDMMIKVVNEGTGSKTKTGKVQIAAKTGTAEVTGSGPNAWFMGFAPAENPRYAIAVVVEDSDAGGGIAGPVMRETLLAALGL